MVKSQFTALESRDFQFTVYKVQIRDVACQHLSVSKHVFYSIFSLKIQKLKKNRRASRAMFSVVN